MSGSASLHGLRPCAAPASPPKQLASNRNEFHLGGQHTSAAAFSAAQSPATIMTAQFERKNIRLPASRYRGQGLYFVTLCFSGRRKFGANSRLASWLLARLRHDAHQCDFGVHAYCLISDHFHILAAGISDNSNLFKFVESFKQDTAIEFTRRARKRLWQAKYYDHILRETDSADRIAWYIWMNPVRRGLCRELKEYRFLGSFTEIGNRMLNGAVPQEWTPLWK